MKANGTALLAGALVLLGSRLPAPAQITNTVMTSADAFVCTGSPNYQSGADLTGLNFGGAGTLAIAPATSAKGEFRSVIRFSLTNLLTQFNTNYGVGNWAVTNIELELTSNWGQGGAQPNNPIFNVIAGGKFVIEWTSSDDWAEGTGNPSLPTTDGVTYNSLPALLAKPHVPLCTNTYIPPGANVHLTWPLPLQTNLLRDIVAGGDVSFYFYAGDDQIGYLFNSHSYGRGNEPLIHVTAIGLPPRLISGRFNSSTFHLTGIGWPGSSYRIEACPDLMAGNWQALGTATAGTNGCLQFDDTGALLHSQHFYRLAN